MVDDAQRIQPLFGRASGILAQAAKDVLDVDDRIVHQFADGDGQAAQGHGVDADAGEFEDDEGDDKGERNGDQRDERRPGVEQEQDEHEGDEDGGVAHDLDDVVDAGLDEMLLAEHVVVQFHPRRQGGAQFGHGFFDGPGQRDRILTRLLRYHHDHAGFAVDGGVAALDLDPFQHPRHVAHGDRCAGAGRHHGVGELRDAPDPPEVADQKLLALLLDETAGAVLVGVGDGAFDLFQGQVVGAKFLGIDLHLILHAAAADGDGVGHAGDRQQARAHRPVGQQAQLHRRDRLAFEADEHDFAHDRRNRTHPWFDAGGQAVAGGGEFLADQLPRQVNVLAPVEFHENDGQADGGDGADSLHAGRAIQGGLDGKGDQGLHFLGRQAFGFGQHRDLRPVEVGQHVHRQSRHLVETIERERERRRQHEEAVLDREMDKLFDHGRAVPGPLESGPAE